MESGKNMSSIQQVINKVQECRTAIRDNMNLESNARHIKALLRNIYSEVLHLGVGDRQQVADDLTDVLEDVSGSNAAVNTKLSSLASSMRSKIISCVASAQAGEADGETSAQQMQSAENASIDKFSSMRTAIASKMAQSGGLPDSVSCMNTTEGQAASYDAEAVDTQIQAYSFPNDVDNAVIAELSRAAGYLDTPAYRAAAAQSGGSLREYCAGLVAAYEDAGADLSRDSYLLLKKVAENAYYDSFHIDRVQTENVGDGEVRVISISDGSGHGLISVYTVMEEAGTPDEHFEYGETEKAVADEVTLASEEYDTFDICGVGGGADAAVIAAMQLDDVHREGLSLIISIDGAGFSRVFIGNYAQDAARIEDRVENYVSTGKMGEVYTAADYLDASASRIYVGSVEYMDGEEQGETEIPWMNWPVSADGEFRTNGEDDSSDVSEEHAQGLGSPQVPRVEESKEEFGKHSQREEKPAGGNGKGKDNEISSNAGGGAGNGGGGAGRKSQATSEKPAAGGSGTNENVANPNSGASNAASSGSRPSSGGGVSSGGGGASKEIRFESDAVKKYVSRLREIDAEMKRIHSDMKSACEKAAGAWTCNTASTVVNMVQKEYVNKAMTNTSKVIQSLVANATNSKDNYEENEKSVAGANQSIESMFD